MKLRIWITFENSKFGERRKVFLSLYFLCNFNGWRSWKGKMHYLNKAKLAYVK